MEVYAGNTKDKTTVVDKVHEIKEDYGIEKIIFVGDHGMVTRSNRDVLKDQKDVQTIGALTHGDMMALLKNKVIHLDLFEDRTIHEVCDPDNPTPVLPVP